MQVQLMDNTLLTPTTLDLNGDLPGNYPLIVPVDGGTVTLLPSGTWYDDVGYTGTWEAVIPERS
jgi:hypothetical protein